MINRRDRLLAGIAMASLATLLTGAVAHAAGEKADPHARPMYGK